MLTSVNFVFCDFDNFMKWNQLKYVYILVLSTSIIIFGQSITEQPETVLFEKIDEIKKNLFCHLNHFFYFCPNLKIFSICKIATYVGRKYGKSFSFPYKFFTNSLS